MIQYEHVNKISIFRGIVSCMIEVEINHVFFDQRPVILVFVLQY